MFRNKKIDYCSQCDCGKKKLIVNKHFYLCETKNKERLDSKKQPKNSIKIKSNIKQHSNRKDDKKERLKAVYEEISKNREHICESCGSKNNLTHSHIIPRSRRSDLVFSDENIIYQCINCHTIWEHGDINEKKKLRNYDNMMNYIYRVDMEYYNLLKFKAGLL